MQRNSKFTLFFSILTAVFVGVGLAFISIQSLKLASGSKFFSSTSRTLGSFMGSSLKTLASVSSDVLGKAAEAYENEEDTTFIYHFSRGYAYSSDKKGNVNLAQKIANADEILETDGPSFGEILSSLIGKRPVDGLFSLKELKIDNKKISALAYAVTNLDRNAVVLQKDADRLLPIASVTKIVTAAVARNLLDPDREIEITEEILSTEGSSGKLRLGEKLKVRELMYPLLMVSSNDTAEALARAYGRKEFIKEMNAWVSSIGAYRTSFQDPSGLSPHNISTAHDISTIINWIEKNQPEIIAITMTKSKTIRVHTWVNPTHFLNLSEYVGGKNGYIPEANLTSVSLFSLGLPKTLYSVVLLGSAQRDADTVSILDKILR